MWIFYIAIASESLIFCLLSKGARRLKMSRTSVLAILAGVGVIFSGVVTTDSVAFARAVQSGESDLLTRFAKQYPDSEYRDDALRLASCTVNWVGGICNGTVEIDRSGTGGGSPGAKEPGAPAPIGYAT
jgi:hypothetical protein